MEKNPPRKVQKFFKCDCGQTFYEFVRTKRKTTLCVACKGIANAVPKSVPKKGPLWVEVSRKEPFCPMCGSAAVRLRADYLCTNKKCRYRAS